MALDPITAGLQLGGDLVTGAVTAVGDYLSTTQLRRLDEANQKANDDVQAFKADLLARNTDSVNLRLNGLQYGVRVNLTPAESGELKLITPGLTACDLLGLYCHAPYPRPSLESLNSSLPDSPPATSSASTATPAVPTLPPSEIKSLKTPPAP